MMALPWPGGNAPKPYRSLANCPDGLGHRSRGCPTRASAVPRHEPGTRRTILISVVGLGSNGLTVAK